MMDDEQVEVVAAADGQIILITDGNKDDNCDLNNSDFWNAVYLKHTDGSTTWYGRLKSGTLTTKEVGDYVNKGEFLGHPGSGGKSFYPHLHFEVYDSQNNSVDPFAGPCNNQIDESLWESQPVYANDDTVVNALLTHSEPPNLQACGQTEYNLSNEFLPGSTMYPAVYFRAVKSGQVLNMKLINPYGSVVSDLDYSFQQDYQSNYFYSSYAIPESAFLIGTWVFQANFLGNVYSINFEVKSSLSTMDITDDVLFLSEINNSKLRIHSNNLISKAEIFDLNGRLIKSKSFNNNDFEIGIHNLKSGIYLINIFNESFEVFKTLKFVKN
jgi:hypothetical protein